MSTKLPISNDFPAIARFVAERDPTLEEKLGTYLCDQHERAIPWLLSGGSLAIMLARGQDIFENCPEDREVYAFTVFRVDSTTGNPVDVLGQAAIDITRHTLYDVELNHIDFSKPTLH